MSTSIAVQPPIPASSRSTGAKWCPRPYHADVAARSLVITYLLFSMRWSRTLRCAGSVVMLATSAPGFPAGLVETLVGQDQGQPSNRVRLIAGSPGAYNSLIPLVVV